jgi:hypothetical protein
MTARHLAPVIPPSSVSACQRRPSIGPSPTQLPASTAGQVQSQFNGTDYLGNSSDPPLGSLSCSFFGNCAAQTSGDRDWLYEVNGTWSMAGVSLADFAISCPDQNWCAIATEDDNGNAKVDSGSVTALADPSAAPGA